MKYTRELIEERYKCGEKLKYIFFWGHTESPGAVTKACFSQWYDCTFTADGTEYRTAEQYMMAQKALLFGDKAVYEEIMAADHPKQFKALGQKVSGFKQEIWDEKCREIVIKGNTEKFSQNPSLGSFLMSTGERILVEASPYDKIWGIGLDQNDARAGNPTLWNGINYLGFCLMEVRDILKGR